MLKALLVGALAVMAVLAIAQAIVVIAPYLAICVVIGFFVWLAFKDDPPKK